MSTRKRKSFSSQNVIATKKNKVSENGCVQRAGCINRMILKNFMCHSLLEVNFDNNISFIIGKNGSGKSAILTALVLGLGGRANVTNRGSTVKNFIKAGKPSANIEIVISNEGPMAFRPNYYGCTIHIIRNILASGSSSYKIKSANGEILSTQAREVQTITTALNIQVDNPICILNQDTSRNFLSSSSPQNRFKLFMRATQLENLCKEYKTILSNKNETLHILNEKKDNFKKLEDEIKQLKVKITTHQSIFSLKDKKSLLQREFAWAKVRDAEEELEKIKQNLDEIEEKLAEHKDSSEKRKENINSINQVTEQLNKKLTEYKNQIEIQKRPQLDLNSNIEELTNNIQSKKRERIKIVTVIDNKKSDIKSLKDEIESSKENKSNAEQQIAEKMNKIDSLKKKLKSLDAQLETSKNDLFQIRGDLSHREQEEDNLKKEIIQIERNLSNEKINLKAISAESDNKLIVYGKDILKIKEIINQNKHKFQQLPRGPLGSYIKIKDKKWAIAVEGYIGPSALRAFVVDNKQDNQILMDIFKKVLGNAPRPEIITTKFVFNKHNVSRFACYEPQGCCSIYNAIEIEDTVVSNCIVDICEPETILLIPSEDYAEKLMSSVQNVPKNCKQGITINGDIYYPDPNYKSYASSYRRAQYLQVDTKEHIKELQQNIEKLTKKRDLTENQLKEFRSTLKERLTRRQELESKVRKINEDRAQVKQQLEILNSTTEPEVATVQFLEQELEESKKIIVEKNAELNKINNDIEEMKEIIADKQKSLLQMKESTKEMEEKIEQIREEIRENQIKQKEISTNKDFEQRVTKEYQDKIERIKSKVTIKTAELEQLIEEANIAGERLSELRRIPDISAEINKIKCKLLQIETNTENLNDLMDKYNEFNAKFDKSVDIMKNLEDHIKQLQFTIQKRHTYYNSIENYFVSYIQFSFKKILESRQFEGNLEINIPEKKLDLIVIPQHGSQGITTTSNLSGGERSFSTVAFLYSLWQCMELPFYFLDEFDVYMDKMNRTKVIDILLQHARSKPQLQFVFLTPQDISFINQEVSILRLEDPKKI